MSNDNNKIFRTWPEVIKQLTKDLPQHLSSILLDTYSSCGVPQHMFDHIDHVSDSGHDFDEDGFHFLTNFIPVDDLQIYEAAIAKFATISPQKQLIIKKAPLGKTDVEMYSLWNKPDPMDLSLFWFIFNKFRDELNSKDPE